MFCWRCHKSNSWWPCDVHRSAWLFCWAEPTLFDVATAVKYTSRPRSDLLHSLMSVFDGWELYHCIFHTFSLVKIFFMCFQTFFAIMFLNELLHFAPVPMIPLAALRYSKIHSQTIYTPKQFCRAGKWVDTPLCLVCRSITLYNNIPDEARASRLWSCLLPSEHTFCRTSGLSQQACNKICFSLDWYRVWAKDVLSIFLGK